jgi:hypothetical protein
MRWLKYNVPVSSSWHSDKIQNRNTPFSIPRTQLDQPGRRRLQRISGALIPNQDKAMTFSRRAKEAEERNNRAGETHYYYLSFSFPGSG